MKLLGVLGIACLFLGTGAADAATFAILGTSGGSPTGLGVGEAITIDVVVTLDPGEDLNTVGASFFDWDNAVVGFTSGQAVGELFFQNPPQNPDPNAPICATYPFICKPSGPIINSRGPALVEGAATAGTGFLGVPEVEIIAAINLTETFVAQAFSDPGLDGNAGTAQFQLVFTGMSAGTTTLLIGFGSDLDGITAGPSTVPNTNTSLTITVPEPGALAASFAALSSVAGIGFIRRRSR